MPSPLGRGDRLRWKRFCLFRPRLRSANFPRGEGVGGPSGRTVPTDRKSEISHLLALDLQLELVSDEGDECQKGGLDKIVIPCYTYQAFLAL